MTFPLWQGVRYTSGVFMQAGVGVVAGTAVNTPVLLRRSVVGTADVCVLPQCCSSAATSTAAFVAHGGWVEYHFSLYGCYFIGRSSVSFATLNCFS